LHAYRRRQRGVGENAGEGEWCFQLMAEQELRQSIKWKKNFLKLVEETNNPPPPFYFHEVHVRGKSETAGEYKSERGNKKRVSVGIRKRTRGSKKRVRER